MNYDFQNTNNDFLSALIGGNKQLCKEIIKNAFAELNSFIDVYEKIIKQSLYKVGELWEYNKISVATEHMATAITGNILNDYYDQIISDVRVNRNVVVACVENEFHQIGIKMVADVFENNGWDTFYLGANIPTHELILFTKSIKNNTIALSLSIYFHLPTLEKMILEIHNAIPDMQILVGGQAFSRGGVEILNKYKNVVYLQNLNSLELYIKRLNKNGQKYTS